MKYTPRRARALKLTIIIAYFLFYIGWLVAAGTIGYVVVHFVSKYW